MSKTSEVLHRHLDKRNLLHNIYHFPHVVNEAYLLLARRRIDDAVETPGVEYKECYWYTECHVVIGHRQYPRDTCPRYLYLQYGERNITLNFICRYQPSWCKENLRSLRDFLKILITRCYNTVLLNFRYSRVLAISNTFTLYRKKQSQYI